MFEVESTTVSQTAIPALAAQPAPSIMRKRGYEHINGVEGDSLTTLLSLDYLQRHY